MPCLRKNINPLQLTNLSDVNSYDLTNGLQFRLLLQLSEVP